MMQIKTVVTGNIEENCHLVWDDNQHCLVIDPGDDCDRILKVISTHHLTVEKVILTHGHYDHVGAVNELKKATGAVVIAHQEEKELILNPDLSLSRYISPDFSIPQVDSYVKEGDVISAGELSFTVMHTPGHTQGGMCLYSEGVLFSGDTVFYGTLGRWDFPTGNLSELTHSITKRIFSLPDNTVIYSGHGPETTVGLEKKQNEVLRWLSI